MIASTFGIFSCVSKNVGGNQAAGLTLVSNGMRHTVVFLAVLAPLCQAAAADEYFAPAHRLLGIGVSRDDLTEDQIAQRADLMIQSQTFSIMREPMAVQGARRITGDRKLQSIFQSAAERSGLPASVIEAIAYLESWGDAKAESPSGPRGIMQIAQGTAREMGLRVVRNIRYRTVKEKVQVRNKKNKLVTKTIRRKVPYSVPGRDDRLLPERAIPAAASYLARLEQRFGGRDWAIFAYHCGEGCVAEMLDLTRRARGIPKDQVTVARMFFSASPAWNRELYQAIQIQMQRDYSPTYWFRVMRAQQLLGLYREDPDAFTALAEDYRTQFPGATGIPTRAPHRLTVWLKRDDLVFHTSSDLRDGSSGKLVRAFERPDYFGYMLRINPEEPQDREYLSEASPAAIGTLNYIAFETHRLWDELKPKGENFRPLEVTSLVEPEDAAVKTSRGEALAHSSGQVFDIDYSGLPPGEYESLRFVLDDLGWEGYLGFVEEGRDSLHIGCSPSSRDFFTKVFEDALRKNSGEQVSGGEGAGVRQDAHIGELKDRPLPAAGLAPDHRDGGDTLHSESKENQ